MTKLSKLIAPHFHKVHNSIRYGRHEEFILKGGRSSTKSSVTSIECVLAIIDDPEANVLILRKHQNSVRKSVWNQVLWAMAMLGVSHKFKTNISVLEITYIPTGQKIIMGGLDDPGKWRSTKLEKGRFKIVWFEEAADFNGMEEIRNLRQSIQRGSDDIFITIFTYNPPNDPRAWINEEAEREYPKRLIHHSTYLDVPYEWNGRAVYEAAERLRQNNPEAYRHEYMGEAVGRAEQIVFHGKWTVEDFPEPDPDEIYQGRMFYGIDWGFANDDLAIVRTFIKDDRIYIDYAEGDVGIEIDQITDKMDEVPGIKKWPILCDSNRPELIKYIQKKGYQAEKVEKWEGIVEDSVQYLRNFEKIVVHPRCDKLIKELTYYSYKVDRHTQRVLPVIPDGQKDHYIDALRYAINEYIKGDVPWWMV